MSAKLFPSPSELKVKKTQETLEDNRLLRIAQKAIQNVNRPHSEVERRGVDVPLMHLMGQMGMQLSEIAAYVGMGRHDFANDLRSVPELREAYEQGLAETKLALRRRQLKAAMDGNVPALVWMGKQMLGQSEKGTITHELAGVDGDRETITVTMSDSLRDRIAAAKAKATPGMKKLLDAELSG